MQDFETLSSKLEMLYDINNYNYSNDYAKQQENIVKKITIDELKKFSEMYLMPINDLFDCRRCETQLKKLEQIGFGTDFLNTPAVK
jgi:zinc protease